MSSIKYEAITLVTATETFWSGNSKRAKIGREATTALDYILPLLEEVGLECKIIDSSTKEYTLLPKTKRRPHRYVTSRAFAESLQEEEEGENHSVIKTEVLLKGKGKQ